MEMITHILTASYAIIITIAVSSNECKGAHVELESSLVSDVTKSDGFVDKTLFIEECLKETTSFVITAPRGFGKSTNLNMLKSFLSIPVDELGYVKERSDTQNYRLFRDNKLAIYEEEPGFFMMYFGKYPVIEVDFKTDVSVRNYDDALEICRRKIHDSFREHIYLTKSKRLTNEEKETCSLWSGDGSYSNVNVDDLRWALYNLSQYLNKHFNEKVFVLVDEYDSIITQAIFTTENNNITLNSTVNLVVDLIVNVLKDNPFIENGILTGVSNIADTVMSPVIDLWVYTFLYHHPFGDYYGFTSEEADALFRSTKFNMSANAIAEAHARYDGYVSKWGKRVYSPLSVLRFLQTGKVENYWTTTFRTEAGQVLDQRIFKIYNFTSRISEMLSDETVTIDFFEDFLIKDVADVKRILSDKNITSSSDVDVYFAFLLQQGYLSFHTKTELDAIKIPNKEIKQVIARKLSDYYGSVYNIPSDQADRCASFFQKVSLSVHDKDLELRGQLKEFQNCLSRLFISVVGKSQITLNETVLHHVINNLLLRTEFYVETNVSTKIKCENGTDVRGRVDFYLVKGNCAIIIEVDYSENRKPVATETVRRILEKEYCSIFQNVKYSPLVIQNYYFLGLSVNNKCHVSVSCLVNSKTIDEAILTEDANV